MEFENLGEKERKILLTAIDYKVDKLKCEYCKVKVNYKDCCIMASDDDRRKATILCDSPVCMSGYLEKTGE